MEGFRTAHAQVLLESLHSGSSGPGHCDEHGKLSSSLGVMAGASLSQQNVVAHGTLTLLERVQLQMKLEE